MPPLTDKVARLKGAFHDDLSKAPKDRGPVYKRSVNRCQSAVSLRPGAGRYPYNGRYMYRLGIAGPNPAFS